MKLLRVLLVGVVMATGAGHVQAQDAQAEKTIIANERAVNDAVAKGSVAAFKQHVAADGWAIDAMSGRDSIANFIKDFTAMTKDTKIASWDITESKIQWVDANTAVHTYKWSGKGTYQGQPLPSPTWASTVWAKKNGQWTAVFHHESIPVPAPGK